MRVYAEKREYECSPAAGSTLILVQLTCKAVRVQCGLSSHGCVTKKTAKAGLEASDGSLTGSVLLTSKVSDVTLFKGAVHSEANHQAG